MSFKTLEEAFNYQNAADVVAGGAGDAAILLLELTTDKDLYQLIELVKKLDTQQDWLTDGGGHAFWLYMVFFKYEDNIWIPVYNHRLDAEELVAAGWQNRILTLDDVRREKKHTRLCVLNATEVKAVLTEKALWDYWSLKWKFDLETAEVIGGEPLEEE